jgi:serine/threonine protein kinase
MEFQDEDNINQTGPIEEFHEKKKQRHTFVGTAEYVSPEVLADKASGIESDLWALGCIIYQCFTGTTPFKEKTEYLIFKKILEHNFTFPDDFPETAKNLVELLLVEKPENRLGAGACLNPDNFLELKRHKFFDGIDFERLHETTIPNKSAFNKLTDSKKSPEKIRQNSVHVIKQDIIEKKSPWFHYNTRKVILYNTPKIDYIDPSKNIVKVI